jgi:23S rRNA pseudouridine2604 synthase
MDTSLNKYISDTGFCSRREADKYIEECRVTINGKDAQKGNRVKEGDDVRIDGEPLKKKKATVYIMLNKPKGITCTTDTKDRTNIIDFVNYKTRIFPIGRLDKLSDGLIFLTNDGDIVNKILRAGNGHEKEYVVTVDKPIEAEFINKMRNGVRILGATTHKCFVKQEGEKRFRIILTQGLNRQIRRMCEVLGYRVVTLTRTRIMNITLSGLAPGKWRLFNAAEINALNELLKYSSKTAEGDGMGE